MDRAEELAKQYLSSQFSSVVFEPDGNIPPDFVVDGRIAVEVRRLNQNKTFGGKNRSLDEESIPLYHKVNKILESLGPPQDDATWFVMMRFARPIPKWKDLRKLIRSALEEKMRQPYEGVMEIEIVERFKVSIAKGSKIYKSHYLLGGASDLDSGGWLLAELEANIAFCAAEKAKKIAKYRHKYREWWLILVDQIAYAMDNFDRDLWGEKGLPMHGWDKIVLLDPLEKNPALEI